MSAFYDLASLVLVPSGYKASKVYAQKPLTTDGQLTFSRSTGATRVASNGLIEKVRTNLILQSNSFSTTWTNSNSTETSGQTGYDGTSNAWLLTASSAGGFIYQDVTIAGLVTFSIYAKAGSEIGITLYSAHASQGRYFNLSTGALGGTFVGAPLNSKIESIGSGWYRCSITVSATATNNFRVYVSNGTANVTGNILIQNSQLEEGDIATQPISTTTAAVSVGPVASVPRLDYLNSSCPRLLLEPQTTALNQFSESFDNAFWIKNDVTVSANTTETLDPAGYYGADKVVETATAARHRVAAGSTTITAANHTASVFMKKGTARYGFVTFSGAAVSTIVVDLENGTITSTSTSGTIVAQKVENYGSGWYRISVTALGTATTTTYTLQFGSAGSATPSYTSNIPSFTGSTSNYLYAWGANLTATSYLQSYVNTLGAAVTRGADAASKTGISSLIGQTEGTLFAEFVNDGNNNASIDRIISTSDGTANNRMYLARLSSGASYFVSVASGTQTGEINGTTMPQGVVKIAVAYKNNDVAMYVNGSLVGTDTSHTTPATSNLYLGQENSGTTNNLWKPYKQALIFKTRLTNAQLAELTTL